MNNFQTTIRGAADFNETDKNESFLCWYVRKMTRDLYRLKTNQAKKQTLNYQSFKF